MKLFLSLSLLILALIPLAHGSIQITNECVYKLKCTTEEVEDLTIEELTYMINSYEIVEKEKLTLEDYTYLHPRTRNWKISSAQLYDIELNALMIAQNEKLPIDTLMFTVEVALHKLKYSFANNDTLKEQIKAFQADIGQATTGVITFGQYVRVNELAEVTSPNTFYIRGTGQASEILTDYVTATGSWDILGEDEAFPINSSYIMCDKTNLECREEYKQFRTHEEKFGLKLPSQSYYFDDGTTYYDVVSWTDEVIIAKPNTPNQCRSVILNINYVTGKVQQIVNNKDAECALPKLQAPRISELVDSVDFQSQYWRKLKNTVQCIKAKSYIAKMQETMKSMGESAIKCQPMTEL